MTFFEMDSSMTNRQFITIRLKNSPGSIDLEVPSEEPLRSFYPDILKIVGQPAFVHEKSVRFSLTTEENIPLDSSKTLSEMGIDNFQTLYLTISEDIQHKEDRIDNIGTTIPKANPELPVGLKGIMPQSLWAQISLSINKPSLVSSLGLIFELGVSPTLIGRYSKGYPPDIDLTEIDINKTTSVRHAEIIFIEEKYFIIAIDEKNDTFLNNIKLKPNEKFAINDGDTILFGLDGVKLVFCLPPSSQSH